MTPPQLHIRLLGPLEVLDGDARLELPPSKKARALLAYLAVTGRPHARGALCDLFWPEVNDPRAGLRWALSKLRGVVHDGERRPICAGRNQVELAVDAVDVDLHRVQSVVSGDPAAASTEALSEAIRAFRGDFAEGLDVPGCHQYEAWCLGTRERLRNLRLSIHATLAGRLRNDPDEALSHALSRLSLDPFSEEAYIAAMDLLAEAGRVDQGMALYERCRRMLSEDLGVPPSDELRSARRRLRTQPRPVPTTKVARSTDPDGTDGLAGALAELPSPEHLPAPEDDEPPLVGRTSELTSLVWVIERSLSDEAGGLALVVGEAGIGKTRLLREYVQKVRAAGGWVLSGPVFETEAVRPYGPWADMLRQVPEGAFDRETRSGLSGLLEHTGSKPDPDGPAERAQLFDAVARLLRRVVEARTPGLVVLDDIQWLDTSSIALLHYVTRTLASTPLVLALAARGEEIASGSAVARMLRSLDETDRLVRVLLQRLDASDTETLVHAVDAELDPTQIFATSEGNPLFTLAVASSVREGIHRTPANIEEELRDRLERLEPGARSLLPWAAALGRAFDVPTLVQVVERPTHAIVEAIGSLERSGILRATGADRFDFTHSLLRQAAYGQPSEPVRRQIHRSIAGTLDAADRSGGRMPGAVAHHAELGGLSEVAAGAYVEAAEECLWVFAFDEAATMVERGLSEVATLPDEARIPLEIRLLQLHTFRSMEAGRPEGLEARIRQVTEEARRQGLRQAVARGHACLMELEYQRGAYDEAGRNSLLSAEAGRDGEPATAARTLAETATCLLLLDQAPEEARRLGSEALRLAAEHGEEIDVVALAGALLHHYEGELEKASADFRQVIRLGRRHKDRWWELPAMTRMIMVELDRGEPDHARERARETEKLAEQMDDAVEAAFARGLGAIAGERVRIGENLTQDGPGGMDALTAALHDLRELDSLWRIGHVQAYAAEVELQQGHVDAARPRVAEALEVARTLQRPSLLALARALWARCDAMEGDLESAARHLNTPEITQPEHRLARRARVGIEQAWAAAEGKTP